MNESTNGLLLTPRQAARELAISERKLWQLTKDGMIPVVKLGRSARYPRQALVEWITETAGKRSDTVAAPDI